MNPAIVSMNWPLTEVLDALGLRHSFQLSDVMARRVVTDSRQVGPGDVFVALKGERFDAHDFLPQVAQQGASLAIVSRAVDPSIPHVVVPDTHQALTLLSKAWRARFDLPLIAVTGSNGKTTSKEMIASILRAQCGADNVLVTQGNLNNDIGVPLTLLNLRPHHRMAVVELGMNHPGEIDGLASLAQPTVALVNNAQREHQEFMESVAAVAVENGAVFNYLHPQGTGVFPNADEFSAVWTDLCAGRPVLEFGFDEGAHVKVAAQTDVHGQVLQLTGPWGELNTELHALGRHNALNAAAAAACAWAAGCNAGAIAQGLSDFRPVRGRMQPVLTVENYLLIDDTYNANPDSVLAAIDVLAGLPGPHVLVLGDMGEVGEQGVQFHTEVGLHAKNKGIKQLVTVGVLSAHAGLSFGEGAVHYENHAAAIQALQTQLNREPHTVLVKGSRFMTMEKIVQALSSSEPSGDRHVA